MVRTQIRLEDTQHRKLKAMAVEHSTSLAQLVREGVDRLLENAERDRRWQKLGKSAGTCHDPQGAPDVAVNHDAYLFEIYSGKA